MSLHLNTLLTERMMLLYGALHQGDVQFNLEETTLTLKSVALPYDDSIIDNYIFQVEEILNEYQQQEEISEDLLNLLKDIKQVYIDIKDRLSWLQ